ncbi:MAG: carboxypeptidase regulatory-like domain-containing protein [Saprospiraceae bacterium]|nr:carboxypeptidase regulatory-like domain-containing protein [Saprospiraceae bacterium]
MTLTYTINSTNFTVLDTTDANGIYTFNNLPPATYAVNFGTPSGYSATTANAGGNSSNSSTTDTNDSDPTGGNVTGIVLAAGENNLGIDAGFNQTVNLGDYVWYDQNNNGIQDPGEPGLAGATVKLYAANGTTLLQTAPVTGNTGAYNFTGLTPGDYVVGVTPPAGYKSSAVDGGDPDNNTLNDDNGTGSGTGEVKSLPITLTSGGEPTNDGDGNNGNLTVDFGFAGTGSIGDLVWRDNDGNGLQGGVGETGIPGVIVTLTYTINSTNFTVLDTTDANGIYTFNNLPSATYAVNFGTPSGYSATTANAGGNSSNSSTTDTNDSDPTGGNVTGIVLAAGENNLGIDAGFNQTVNLGDYVWFDQNNNGIQDPGEPGLAGATVKLYAANGTTLLQTAPVTGNTGAYNFTGLTPGDYVVGVTPPAGYKSSAVDGGDPDNNTLNDDNGTGSGTGEVKSLPITLTSGGEPTNDGDGNNGNLTVDFGFAGTGSIGDLVWRDNDGNGLQGGVGETGIPGVIVTLTYTINSTNFTVLDTTDANGIYTFNNLPPATYAVNFGTPSGYSATTANAGGNSSNSSTTDTNDSDPTGGNVTGIVLAAGENNLGIDAGFNQTVNLGDYVWFDQNNNGIQDPGEPGLAGATVKLYAANGTTLLQTAPVTGNTGAYNFTGLTPGDYVVGVTPPAGYKSSAVDGGDPDNNTLNDDNGTGSGTGEVKSLPITLTSGGEPTNDGDGNNGNLTVDFGFAGTGSIGDFVWKDLNANGIQNGGGETGVSGVIVTLTYTINSTSFTIKDTTDANGLYLFPNLPPSSTYTLSFSNVPAGMVISPSNAGDDNFDSDGLGAIAITLAAGQNDLSNDLGLYAPAAIGNFVWHDLNANGIQDPGEPGISGVSVSLSGGPSTPPATNTDGNGKYLFSNLTPGTYTVTFGTPAGGYLASPANIGSTTDDKDSDAGSGGTTSAYTLVSGQTDTTVDAGFYKLASLGDYVWYDKNKNGIQDNIIDPNGNIVGPEMPVQGISVQLKRVSDNSVAGTAVTNSSGFYLFSNVIPGDYYVQMVTATIPANFDITQKDVSGNTMDSKDSDFNPATGKSDNTNLTSGENDLTWDMGIYMISASIVDPCICKNNATNGKNGQFDEILDVMATPGGSWMIIQQTGMYLSTSPAPPAAPIPVPVGTMLNNVGLGMYRYNFVHIDSLGYTVRVTNGTDTLMITNLCPYPDVIMAAFDTALCIYDAPINLMATANMPGTIDYIITTSGNTEIHTNVIDPATLGMGTFTLKLTFTPLDPTLCQNTYIQSFNISINNCPAALGNFVWNDQNANGKQDPGEPGIPNVNVTLTNVTTAATTNAMTNPNGKYLFNNLAPGTYKVTFGTPAGYIPTTANAAGVLDDVDSDAGAGGMTGNYVLIAGQVDSTVDAGFFTCPTLNLRDTGVCGTFSINLNQISHRYYKVALGLMKVFLWMLLQQ